MAGLSSLGLIQNRLAVAVLAVIAVLLIGNGVYEVWGRQRLFLERRVKGWLSGSGWSVRSEAQPGFYFWIWAKDHAGRELGVSREKKNNGILAFTAVVPLEQDWIAGLAGLDAAQRYRVVEDIKIFLASKDIGYDKVEWPLSKVTVQGGLALDNNISRYLVDLKAKGIINAVIGVRSVVRKGVAC